jgi:precorrin-6A/cobalt-precorrin-6A reductase
LKEELSVILILGGTRESIDKAHELTQKNIPFIITVATDYGFRSFSEFFQKKTIKINFTPESLTQFITEKSITHVYDCTHPYASVITETAKKVCNTTKIPYCSFIRDTDDIFIDYENVITVRGFNDAVELIKNSSRDRILLTSGSKDIGLFKDIMDREVFVRVLPDVQSITACLDAGIKQRNIIAIQGPFPVEFNIALIKLHDIQCLVTKKSGKSGGFLEKIEACRQTDTEALVVEKESDVNS